MAILRFAGGLTPGLTALSLVGILAACSVGPDYKRPDIAVPQQWGGSNEQNAPAWPTAGWWRNFHSPELEDLVAQAEMANNDIGAATARIREADAQARIAGAALLPTLGAGGGITRAHPAPTVTSSGQGMPPTFTSSDAALNASYELDFWGKNRAGLTAAQAAAQATRYDREVVALTVLSGVATTYFQILALHDRIAVTQSQITAAEGLLKALQLEDSVGTATALDVAQQETVLATLNAELPPLQQQLQQNSDALAILIGKLPQDVPIVSGSLADLSDPEIGAGLPAGLLERRPDVAEAEAQLVSANADITIARAAFFPDIQLTAQGGVASVALSSLFGPASTFYAIAASATQPIFEGGRLEGQLTYSRARYDELVQNYRKSVISAFSDVENSLAATQFTQTQQDRQQIAVETAHRAFNIATAQLRAGTVNLLTVLNTENTLFPAEDSLVQARLARIQASVGLYKALGGGWTLDTK